MSNDFGFGKPEGTAYEAFALPSAEQVSPLKGLPPIPSESPTGAAAVNASPLMNSMPFEKIDEILERGMEGGGFIR